MSQAQVMEQATPDCSDYRTGFLRPVCDSISPTPLVEHESISKQENGSAKLASKRKLEGT